MAENILVSFLTLVLVAALFALLTFTKVGNTLAFALRGIPLWVSCTVGAAFVAYDVVHENYGGAAVLALLFGISIVYAVRSREILDQDEP